MSFAELHLKFRNPREIFHLLCCAMAERSINIDQQEIDDLHARYRPEVWGVHNAPKFPDIKHLWIPGGAFSSTGIFEFMRDRIMLIASRYCDAEKAFDFEKYPDLQNWSKESLEDKLKENYMEFSAFCDMGKYLHFLCRVLNLCSVRRVGICGEHGVVNYRTSGEKTFMYGDIAEAKKELLEADFVSGSDPKHELSATCRDDLSYRLIQNKLRFLSWIDETRQCDITFYGFAADELDEFSSFGNSSIRKNSWFCAGKAEKTELAGGIIRAAAVLDMNDSELPMIPELKRNQTWRCGFALKHFTNSVHRDCYGYAVRDQRNYLKY